MEYMVELKRIHRAMRSNGKARGRSVEITLEELVSLWNSSGGRCVISGVPFDLTPMRGKRRPFAPSLDRVDPALGYSKANCRLVCVAVNYAMSDWGLAVLRRIAVGLLTTNPAEEVRNARGLAGVLVRIYRGQTVYDASICRAGKRIYLGRHPTAWDAHMAYRQALQAAESGEQVLGRRSKAKLHQNPISYAANEP